MRMQTMNEGEMRHLNSSVSDVAAEGNSFLSSSPDFSSARTARIPSPRNMNSARRNTDVIMKMNSASLSELDDTSQRYFSKKRV